MLNHMQGKPLNWQCEVPPGMADFFAKGEPEACVSLFEAIVWFMVAVGNYLRGLYGMVGFISVSWLRSFRRRSLQQSWAQARSDN